MPLILREAIAADAPAMTDIFFSAFSKDAISLLAFPRSQLATSKAWWLNSIHEEIKDPNSHFVLVYDSSQPDNLPVAYAKWNAPAPPSPPDPLPEWPEGADEEVANHFFGNLIKRHGEIMGEKRHWYLEVLATRMEYQGKGAGGVLLRWGIERADQDVDEKGVGKECYLEASPAGKPIYERLGYKEVDRLVVSLEGKDIEGLEEEKEFIECFMVREGKGKKSKKN